jgi:hypothetical protein
MARLSDHDLRDAEDAIRKEVSLVMGQYSRRILEMAKAYAQEGIESAIQDEEEINGVAIGRAAAKRALSPYFGGLAGHVHEIIDGASGDSNENPALSA